jgi:lipopolysaccharide transport system ATP-binding protein
MSNIAVRTVGLGKRYHVAAVKRGYRTAREAVTDSAKAPFRRAAKLLRGQATGAAELDETFWALRDVSLEARQGEVLGIVGRNGAGKTTLLKVLSRITEPNAGFAEIRGRVGALLEVGTGFHPELTGRENVFLNGAILGMRRTEIARKFDEIVAFAEVERFIDTPVKHYSNGMRLRLGFSVAAHLETEIIFVDEVLSVGDAAFQKRCFNKMDGIGEQGRTVFLVSHNMPAVTRLCPRTILLDEGRIVADGPSHQVVGTYLDSGLGTSAVREWPDVAEAPGRELARLRAVRVRLADGQVSEAVDIRKPVALEMEYDVLRSGRQLLPNYHLINQDGIHVIAALEADPAWKGRPRPAGRYVSTAWIPGNLLAEGTFFVNAELYTVNPRSQEFRASEAVAFHVIDTLEGDSARGEYGGRIRGVIRPLLEWKTRLVSDLAATHPSA